MNQSQLKKISINCSNKIIAKGIFLEPYKQLVVDNFLPIDLAEKCLSNFPTVNDSIWEYENDNDIEVKSRTTWTSERYGGPNFVPATQLSTRGSADQHQYPVLKIQDFRFQKYFQKIQK